MQENSAAYQSVNDALQAKLDTLVPILAGIKTPADLIHHEKDLVELLYVLGCAKHQATLYPPTQSDSQRELEPMISEEVESVVWQAEELNVYTEPAAATLPPEEVNVTPNQDTAAERAYAAEQKLKLGKIKALAQKTAQNEPVKQDRTQQEAPAFAGRTITLALNDRIAILRDLYHENSAEMQADLQLLAQYPTKDAAKEFLSQRYYERDWKRSDEVAQRYWAVVEHHFDIA